MLTEEGKMGEQGRGETESAEGGVRGRERERERVMRQIS